MKTPRFNSHEILVKHYAEQIRKWDWSGIVRDADKNGHPYEGGVPDWTTWLGTMMGLAPSGKIYTCWTTNKTSSHVRRDEAFWDALEQVAEEKGGYITFEDDSVFFGIEPLDQPDDEVEAIANGECQDDY